VDLPSETFERTTTVSADPGRCWATITDLNRLVGWIAILSNAKEIDPLARYTAVLADRMGMFALQADLAIEVVALEPGRSISLVAEGEDRKVASRLFVEGSLDLEPLDEGTQLRVTGRYEVTGRVATFGGPMIRAKANGILDDFLAGMARDLA
jgi:carbon monoxide dehydrogenase subunit G